MIFCNLAFDIPQKTNHANIVGQMKIKKAYIKNLIKLKSLKQKEIAGMIGVSSQDWNNWMFRGVFPHYNKLEELAQILEVDAGDLTTDNIFTEPQSTYKNSPQLHIDDAVPYFDLDSNDIFQLLNGKVNQFTPSDYTYIPGLAADFIITYFGKDMGPLITSGDLMAIRKITDHSFFNYGNLYLVATEEQIIVRYLNRGTKKNTVTLTSINTEYNPIEIPVKKLKSIYIVVTTIKRQVI